MNNKEIENKLKSSCLNSSDISVVLDKMTYLFRGEKMERNILWIEGIDKEDEDIANSVMNEFGIYNFW